MKFVEKDEIYSWCPCDSEAFADAEVPDELYADLDKGLEAYKTACRAIYQYLKENPHRGKL